MSEAVLTMAMIGHLPQETADARHLLDVLEDSFHQALGDTQTRWLLSPAYSDAAWLALAKQRGAQCQIVRRESDAAWADAGDCQVVTHARLRSYEGDWLLANADVLFIVYGEQAGEMDGAVWEMLCRAHNEHIPCVWLSSLTGKAYWPMESYYEPFQKDDFVRLLARMYARNAPAEDENESLAARLMLRWGGALQRRFLAKHTPSTGERYEPRDVLIERPAQQQQGEMQRQLAALFQTHDRDAIDYGEKYRAVMYWRAVLPTIATVCLAIGIYVSDIPAIIRTIAGWLGLGVGATAEGVFAALDAPLHALSGIGFLVNGFILLYAYRMSQASTLERWHQRYVNSRQAAEVYRILAHYAPYGIGIDLRRILSGNAQVLSTVRGEVRRIAPEHVTLDDALLDEVLRHTGEMLEDQSAYHEKSVRRYEAVTSALVRRASVLKQLGFFWLLVRAVTQFFIGMGVIGQGNKTGTIANMIAMVLPAVATYFSAKNEQCKYEFHLENHRMMKKNIDGARVRIEEIRESAGTPSVELVASVAQTISELMIVDDTSNWHEKISKAGFTQL